MVIHPLPSPDTVRWTVRLKARVVSAVHCGLLSLTECLHRYKMSKEEFYSWELAIESGDIKRLKATKFQEFRK